VVHARAARADRADRPRDARRRHWRAYSLTPDPERPDGCISITVRNVDEGVVSPYLVKRGRPGSIVSLGGVEGEFVLPDELLEKLLFISAGTTPAR
jgi:ferredoxin-NADP reductase